MGSIYYSKRLVKKRPKKGPNAPEKPRSFRSEASAKEWAEKHNIKKFRIECIGKNSNKFKIRVRF